MSDEANVEAAPEAPAEAKPKKVKVLPKITRKFRNRESGALITVVSDPNTDTHVETVELGGKVVSVTTAGNGIAASEPNTATELAKNNNGAWPARACCARKPSSRTRVASRLERNPNSKSVSHSPETAEAK